MGSTRGKSCGNCPSKGIKMIVESIIPELLFNHIAAFDPSIPVAYPNVSFSPPVDAYLEIRFLPNSNRNLYVGNDDPTQYVGIFQVTVVSPSNVGEIAPRETAARLVEHFKKGTRLQKGDIILSVYSRPSVASSMQDGNRYRVPISIQYQCIHK